MSILPVSPNKSNRFPTTTLGLGPGIAIRFFQNGECPFCQIKTVKTTTKNVTSNAKYILSVSKCLARKIVF